MIKLFVRRLFAAYLRREILAAADRRARALAVAGRMNRYLEQAQKQLVRVNASIDMTTPAADVIVDVPTLGHERMLDSVAAIRRLA